ncbi:MAG: hypothetical protein ACYCT7_03305 [bacterium]
MDIQKVIEKYVKEDLKRYKAKSFKKDLMLIPHFNISKKKLNKYVKIIKK